MAHIHIAKENVHLHKITKSKVKPYGAGGKAVYSYLPSDHPRSHSVAGQSPLVAARLFALEELNRPRGGRQLLRICEEQLEQICIDLQLLRGG